MKTKYLLLALSLALTPSAPAATTITLLEDSQCLLIGSFVIDPADRHWVGGGPLLITFRDDPDSPDGTDWGTDVYVQAFWHDPWGSFGFNFGDPDTPQFSGTFTGNGHDDVFWLESKYVGDQVHGTFFFASTECDRLPEGSPGMPLFLGALLAAGAIRRRMARGGPVAA